MPPPSLEETLDQLYAADPEEFVALRKRLQGELRSAGLKPEAALLARARRPSTSMWAVNQLVRRRPELVDGLLERSEALRNAQTSGDRDAMREAIRAHRTAVAEATDAALDVLGDRANEAFREEILSVLRAASTEPELGHELRVGRLVRADDLTPAFPEFGGFSPSARDERPRREARVDVPKSAEPTGKQDDAVRATRAAARETEIERAHEEEASAQADVDAAHRRVDELGEQLADARRELKEAKSRVRDAHAAMVRLEKQLERDT